MAAALLAAGIGAGASIYNGRQQAKASKRAVAGQEASVERGVNESGVLYNQGQGYLAPYVDAGSGSLDLLRDIRGDNGVERQNGALQMYRTNPSAQLLDDVNNEAVRRTIGTFSANGNANSGAATEELGRRLSDIRMADYGNWQNLSNGMMNTGFNAANQSAGFANNRGETILGARTGQGLARASGIVGAANASAGGFNGAANWLNYGLGRSGNDFSNLFGKGYSGSLSGGG